MNKNQKSILLASVGTLLFIIALFWLLPIEGLYLLALLTMFAGVILIGVGTALAKGFDRTIETPAEDCYFCGGTGIVDSPEGKRPCPRCGGTGIAPDADTTGL